MFAGNLFIHFFYGFKNERRKFHWTGTIQLVHTHFKTCSDAQHCFTRHSESKTGIHSKSMDSYKEFLKQVSWNNDPVEK